MPDLDLTSTPLNLRISLTRGEDFVRVIEPLNEDGTPGTFADGTVLILDFGAAGQWPATVSSSEATWNVDKVVVDALIADLGGARRCVLRYQLGTVDRVWAAGPVIVNG